MKPLRILIADDHELFRRGVRALLQSRSGWEICGEASTGRQAVKQAQDLQPDIVILDITMPELNGADVTRRIRKASPNIEVLILSMHYSDQLIRAIVDAGAHGYVLKSDSDHELVTAIEALASHKLFFTRRASEVIKRNANMHGTVKQIPKHIRERLTSREYDVVHLIVEGKKNKQIASCLGISIKTVQTHRINVMRKLDVHTTAELVRYALRNKIVEP